MPGEQAIDLLLGWGDMHYSALERVCYMVGVVCRIDEPAVRDCKALSKALVGS
jgi:hypothetical protein